MFSVYISPFCGEKNPDDIVKKVLVVHHERGSLKIPYK